MVCLSRLCTILLLVLLVLFLLEFSNRRSNKKEGLDTVSSVKTDTSVPTVSVQSVTGSPDDLQEYFSNPSTNLNIPQNNAVFTVKPPSTEEEKTAINQFGKQMAEDMGKTNFNVKDFLPQEINAEWFQTDLSNASETLDAAALIDISKFCSGVDTVGQSLKNPSYDIRGNIPNPKIVVSPFLNSSYDPDTNIKSWC